MRQGERPAEDEVGAERRAREAQHAPPPARARVGDAEAEGEATDGRDEVLRAVEARREPDDRDGEQQRRRDEVERDDARSAPGHASTFRTARGSWSSAPTVTTSASPMRLRAGASVRASATTTSERTP